MSVEGVADQQGAPSEARGSHGPAFVMVGPLRSGTTLLRLLMANHPRIGAVGEFEESVSQAGESGWPELGWYRAWLAQNRAAGMKRYDLPSDVASYPDLVRSMWAQLAGRHAEPLVTCTIHSRFDRVRELWPETKFIFLVRDPRDVARSCVGMGWVGEPSRGSSYWTEPVRRWLRLRGTLNDGDFVELRYEDLLRNPRAELDRCCRLVGERFDPAMLLFHETSTYGPLDPALAEQWRVRLTPRQAELIEHACGELLDRFGYDRSVERARGPGRLESVGLRVRDRAGRFRRRLRRYGLGLTIAWALVKRLPIGAGPRRRVRLRLNEIDMRHLK